MSNQLLVPEPSVASILGELGRGVAVGRARLGISQEVLGRWAGMSQSTVSRLERGLAVSLPLERYARTLAVIRTGRGLPDWDTREMRFARGQEREERRRRQLAAIIAHRREQRVRARPNAQVVPAYAPASQPGQVGLRPSDWGELSPHGD